MKLSDNQKIGVGILSLAAVYFIAMKLISNAAKDDTKKIMNAIGADECPNYPPNAIGKARIIGKDKNGYNVFLDTNGTYWYITFGTTSKGQKWCQYTASKSNPLQLKVK